MTARGSIFLWALVALALAAVFAGNGPVFLLVGVLLFWLLLQAGLFYLQTQCLWQHARLERTINGVAATPVVGTGQNRADWPTSARLTCWSNRQFPVQVTLTCESVWLDVLVEARDYVPAVGQVIGETGQQQRWHADLPIQLAYSFLCPSPGLARWEGVMINVTDLHGLFRRALTFRAPVIAHVLPALGVESDTPMLTKASNALPAQGYHRFRRPGSGSELLDLRDYQPGDPPRTVAWKISARRDRLMTKEYETEVPVRCTIFLDASDAVRVGPAGHTPLVRLLLLTAGLAQRLIATRDPIGLVLIEDDQQRVLKPSPAPRQLLQFYREMARLGAKSPTSPAVELETLIPIAYEFCQQVYPELLAVTSSRSLFGSGVSRFILPWYLYVPVFILSAFIGSVVQMLPRTYQSFDPMRIFWICLLVAVLGWSILAISRWIDRIRYWGLRRQRKQLAAVLATYFHSGPGTLALYQKNNRAMQLDLQRFLGEHQIPIPLALYNRQGEYQFAATGKITQFARQLVQAVARAKDNEAFILMVDLFELEEHWGTLLQAMQLALVKHHQVLLVAPWPEEIPLPVLTATGQAVTADKSVKLTPSATTAAAPVENAGASAVPFAPVELTKILNEVQSPEFALAQLQQWRYQEMYQRLLARLRPMRIPLVCARQSDAIDRILDRIERLRHAIGWP